jgi:hypothetical protein
MRVGSVLMLFGHSIRKKHTMPGGAGKIPALPVQLFSFFLRHSRASVTAANHLQEPDPPARFGSRP